MNKSLMMVIAALLVIVGLVMSGYNNLVEMNENVNGKWSQIENQLQRRNDLIPNLVESDVFKAVADARAKLGGAQSVAETSEADGELSSALSRLLMVAENYPQLQANTNFTQLQDELAGTENRLGRHRKPSCRIPPGLQQRGAGVQCQNQAVPHRYLRRHAWL